MAGDTVNISAKWEFDGKDVGTNTIKVSDIKADNENYEIVGEDNLPVSSTTINNSTAVIKPATPENVTAKADKKTNNIVLSGTTADFEYSTDNGATWVKAAAGTTTIENAVRNKEYTILVRTAATTSAPASDAATVKATTYKYLVNIIRMVQQPAQNLNIRFIQMMKKLMQLRMTLHSVSSILMFFNTHLQDSEHTSQIQLAQHQQM